MPYHCERGYGVSGIVACPPFIESPVLHFDYRRSLDSTGLKPVWRNLGSLGSACDGTAPGGAGNPTALQSGRPGYSFDGGDYLSLPASQVFTGTQAITVSCWFQGDGYLFSLITAAGQKFHAMNSWIAANNYVFSDAVNAANNLKFTPQPSLTTPHHAVLSTTSTTYLYSLDGVEILRGNFAVALNRGAITAMTIGTSTSAFTGSIFSISVFCHGLPEQRVHRYLYERDRHLVGA